jgi:hypothetical protein
MPTLRELSMWIRDYGHDPRHQSRLLADRFVWHQLWTAMDVIDDVDSALTAYEQNDFPTNIGEKYLRIYGALQGLFIQQDALRDLIKVIHPTKEIAFNDVLKDIREVRNKSIGHPTRMERKGVLSAHGIVQNSMRKEGFELLSYPEKPKMLWYVPLQELIQKQRAEAILILSEVVEELRDQERAHRLQFREVKLMEVFHLAGYAFEKISEELGRDSGPMLSSWAVEHLQECLVTFEKLLNKRGLTLDTYDVVEYLYDEIKHPLTELTKFLRREPSEVLSNKSAAVFAQALQTYFDRLRHIADEIDEEYSSEPEPVVRPEPSGTPITFTIENIGSKS